MADLDKLEKDWKSGKLSNVAIGKKHDVTEAYVRKVAKRYNWQRGAAVTPPRPPAPPRELLRRDAPQTADMDDRALSQDLIRRMLDELDTVTAHVGELEQLIKQYTANDRDGRQYAAMMKAISLPVRTNTLKTLIASLAEAEPEGKKGKKEKQLDAAKAAGSAGKYKSSAPPGALRVVGGEG